MKILLVPSQFRKIEKSHSSLTKRSVEEIAMFIGESVAVICS